MKTKQEKAMSNKKYWIIKIPSKANKQHFQSYIIAEFSYQAHVKPYNQQPKRSLQTQRITVLRATNVGRVTW